MIGTVFTMTYSRTKKVWQFPKYRFVEYEAKDEEWCRRLGFGKGVEMIETITIPNAVMNGIKVSPMEDRIEYTINMRMLEMIGSM